MKNNFWLKLTPERTQFILDLITLTISFVLFFNIRFESGVFNSSLEYDYMDLIWVNLSFLVYWITSFWAMGLYKNMYDISPFEEFWKIIKTSFFGSFIIFFLVFIDSKDTPRLVFLIYFGLVASLSYLGRVASRYLHKSLRRRRIIAYPTIVISKLTDSQKLLDMLSSASAWGLAPKGFVYIDKDEFLQNKGESIHGLRDYPILGHIEFLPEIIDAYHPKEIIIADESSNHDVLMNMAAYCSDKGIKVKIPPTLYDIFTGQARAFPLYGIPFIQINTQLLKPWEEALKRLMDITFSAAVVIIGSPFWAILSLAVKLDSPGKIFYTQPRVGKNGKVFTIFKYRSMVSNADKIGGLWTSVNDSRVTKFGRFIRKTHLDEIPQFWNVLIGDMSVVGPRPEQPKIVDKYNAELSYYGRRHLVRPGITGWWQVNYGPHQENIEEIKNRLKDDFYYIENMSIKLDIEIIIRTVYCVLKGHGQA
jgi:exopolysaccharide biosynthesis polyprenyl glycosylphosphotransferase